MRRIPGLLSVVGALAALAGSPAATTLADETTVAEERVQDAAPTLDAVLQTLAPPPSAEALSRIPDPGRKLLALRSYLRSGARIADRWSWTEDRIKAFRGSPEEAALLAEIEAVNQHFSAANPGYEIYVHATVRSLDEQIASWNRNASVGTGAEELVHAYAVAFGEAGLEPGNMDGAKLGAWLRGFTPTKSVNLAAPGLTHHGRAGAIDFQVMKNGAIHAGADSAQVESVWRAEGWDKKLKASIEAAGPSFSGPLTDPDEPWHYDYVPKPPASPEEARPCGPGQPPAEPVDGAPCPSPVGTEARAAG